MKVTFVELGMENLAVSILAALAKREGHQVTLAFTPALFHDRLQLEMPGLAKYFDDTSEVIQKIVDDNPDVLAFSALTSQYQWMLQVAKEAKSLLPHVKTVFGGVHVSAIPDRVISKSEVDYVVVGEGDVAFVEILNAIQQGKHDNPIVNTRFKNEKGEVIKGPQTGFIQDLDSLPHYDKEIWEDHSTMIRDFYLTMASRGCPYTCSFCFNNFFAKLPEEKGGKYVRQRSVEHMMEELLYAKKRYNIKAVNFQDDIFTVRKPWLKAFLKRYKKEINLPFNCLTHPRYMDDEVAKWLADAGCQWIQMGIQTMDDEFRNQTIRRYEKSDHIIQALEAMHKYGLKTKVDHMFGLPGEPIEAQETARKVYAEQQPTRIQTFWTGYLPGTDLMKEGIESGEVSQEAAEKIYEGEDFFFFRNEANVKHPEMVKQYRNYETLFKIFPLLPGKIRKKIKITHINWIPYAIARPMAQFVDLIFGFWYSNMDLNWYWKYYLFHLYRHFRVKLGFKAPKAIIPNRDDTVIRTESNKPGGITLATSKVTQQDI